MNPFFIEALNIREHPIINAKKKIQIEYFFALKYIVEKAISNSNTKLTEFKNILDMRMQLYQNQLVSDKSTVDFDAHNGLQCLTLFLKPWRNKYRFMLICDIALILIDETLVSEGMKIFKEYLTVKRQREIEQIMVLLNNDGDVEKKYQLSLPLIKQYRANKNFIAKPERRIIVTANMSAGKSTLINALVGKPLVRTSQEVCTGNICYLFNKAYEDDNIHLSAQKLNLCASDEELQNYEWNCHIAIASYFAGLGTNIPRLCIVDTPGVDAALHKEHSECTHNALLGNDYDIILYVVSPTRLGTDAEKKHLQWVAKNLQNKKIIFVLNKLDNYHDFSDSIENSIRDFKEDLLKIGFEKPVICPISAYFSYLLKMRLTGHALSEDESDEYNLYAKKFNRTTYDLSHYYEGAQCLPTDSEEITLSKRAGLYGFEKIIYGGKL